MELSTLWFILIAVLWIGYLVLEGFDFGVGMLLKYLPRDEQERRVALNTIGPHWDGNEVWLLTAGGATFAAFPNWYATLFSGFYLPLFLILVALILRGVAFEYRGKVDAVRWRRSWDLAIGIGSWVPSVLWGVAFANIVHGVPINADGDFTGNLFTLLNPFGLLGGLTTASLFLLHGLHFVALKTDGEIRDRARSLALRVAPVPVVAAAGFLVWNQVASGPGWTWPVVAVAALALVGSVEAGRRGRDGWSFVGTGLAIALAVVALFGGLFPDVMPSTTDPAFSLTVHNASSTAYTLKVMTVVAGVMTPLVLAYQAWSYWVFRRRIGVTHIPAGHHPAARAAGG